MVKKLLADASLGHAKSFLCKFGLGLSLLESVLQCSVMPKRGTGGTAVASHGSHSSEVDRKDMLGSFAALPHLGRPSPLKVRDMSPIDRRQSKGLEVMGVRAFVILYKEGRCISNGALQDGRILGSRSFEPSVEPANFDEILACSDSMRINLFGYRPQAKAFNAE